MSHLVKHTRGGCTLATSLEGARAIVRATYGETTSAALKVPGKSLREFDPQAELHSTDAFGHVALIIDVGDDLIEAERLHAARAEWSAMVKAQRVELSALREQARPVEVIDHSDSPCIFPACPPGCSCSEQAG